MEKAKFGQQETEMVIKVSNLALPQSSHSCLHITQAMPKISHLNLQHMNNLSKTRLGTPHVKQQKVNATGKENQNTSV